MLNRHEMSVLAISQLSLIVSVQNVFPIFMTYGQRLPANDPYFIDSRNSSANNFYRFSHVESFYSAFLEFKSNGDNVESFWWRKITTIQVIGVFFGSLIFGFLADKIGRRIICQTSMAMLFVVLLIEGFMQSMAIIASTRFIIGVLTGSVIVVSWSLVSEIIQPRTRFLARAFANWPNARLILTIICYLTANWRLSLHVSSIFALFTTILLITSIPESPTWLQCNKRFDEAIAEREKIFKRSNGACEIKLPDQTSRSHRLTFFSVWKQTQFRNIMLLCGALWILTNFTSTMIDFSEVVIVKGLMQSQLLIAGVLATSKMILGVIEMAFGIISRRNLHLFSLGTSTFCMLVTGVLVTLGMNKSYPGLYCAVFLIGIVFLEFVWDACYLCVVEQIPTEVRGTVCGTCSFLSRMAAVGATLMADVKQLWAPAPLFTASFALAVHFVIAFYFLSESKDANLAEVGFDLRRVSRKLSQRISQRINKIRKTST